MPTLRLIAAAALVAAAACSSEPTEVDPATSPTVSPTDTGAGTHVPTGFVECENSVDGYAVAYPQDWYTASTEGANECRWFDREPLTLDEGSEPPPLDAEVFSDDRDFDSYVERITADDSGEEIASSEETTIGEYRAFRWESTANGEAGNEAGTRTYGIVLDVDGRTFVVQTQLRPGGQEPFDENMTIVDQMAATIRLTA